MQSSNTKPRYVLIDWGTSSFRLWVVNSDGDILASKFEPLGMSTLSAPDYEPLLDKLLTELGVSADVPVLICGMAGSANGWHEAPYIALPTALDEIPLHAVTVKTKLRDVRIIAGLAQRIETSPDVMRGEETILMGAQVMGHHHEVYCLPGTHTKYVQMEDSKVTSFRTFMTGELFALLAKHSTLSYFLNSGGKGLCEHESFRLAVHAVRSKPEFLVSELFSIRSGALLFPTDDDLAKSARLSGLLIGAELATMKPYLTTDVGLISEGVLAQTYCAAMDVLEIKHTVINSDELALAGLKFAADILFSNAPQTARR